MFFHPRCLFIDIIINIIQPKIDWGYTCQQNLNKIQRLQSRAARIVSGNYDYVITRVTELVESLQWMNVHERRYYFMSILLLKCLHGLAPDHSFCVTKWPLAMQSETSSERTTRSLCTCAIVYASIECFKKYLKLFFKLFYL